MDPEASSHRLAQIDDAPAVERTAVVDPPDSRPAVLEVRHPDTGAEGKAAARQGERVAVEALAGGGPATVETRSVPARLPDEDTFLGNVDDPASRAPRTGLPLATRIHHGGGGKHREEPAHHAAGERQALRWGCVSEHWIIRRGVEPAPYTARGGTRTLLQDHPSRSRWSRRSSGSCSRPRRAP